MVVLVFLVFTTVVVGCTPPTRAIEEVEREIFDSVNAARIENGALPTMWDPYLYRLAKQHTEKMASNDSPFHSSVDKPYREVIMVSTGQSYSSEIFADGTTNGWMNSPGHRQYILWKYISRSAVSISVGRKFTYTVWTFWREDLKDFPYYSPLLTPKFRS